MIYYSRTDGTQDKSQWPTVKEHLEAVAKLASRFSEKFGSKDFGYVIGLLHDLGKYSKEFQNRLDDNRIRVDHSTAGAQEVFHQYNKALALLAAYCIAGHHSGLPDYGSLANPSSLEGRLQKKTIPEYKHYKQEIAELPSLAGFRIPLKDGNGFSVSFYIRMLFSCLVDADSLDAESASGSPHTYYRGINCDFNDLYGKLTDYLQQKIENAPKTEINEYRKTIQKSCFSKADGIPGMYSLTVPTGGGKTFCSLGFALKHAIRNGLERIIYVIPYTSIIEQNAKDFRDVLGEEYVLEHHSNYQFPDDWESSDEKDKRLSLAVENWDAPIVVTTNVQFFESLFSAKRSKCRKLHNIANSVIILDEAQMLPGDYLKPCLASLAELVKNYHVSVVFCTATQPAINAYIPDGLRPLELTDDPRDLYRKFKRVKCQFLGDLMDNELVERLEDESQVLCIVNSRRHAKLLYDQLGFLEGAFHLSARMCPAHRRKRLLEIKEALQQGCQCRVVSTQLIEAGVNIDFPTVYRSLSGLDSIAQAAGRCNREGKLDFGTVNVFSPEKHGMPGGWLSRTAEIARMVMQDFEDPLCLDAVKAYFEMLYGTDEALLDKKQIICSLREEEKRLAFPFGEVSNSFRLIDGEMISIIIPWDDRCKNLLTETRTSLYPGSFGRKLQPYVVQVYWFEYQTLVDAEAIEDIAGIFKVLISPDLYSEETGLLMPEGVSISNEVLIF